jgi:SAM-dependent methyltransferase
MTDDQVLEGQRRLWSAGDYPAVARHLEPASMALLDAIGLQPGARVLDVGVGTGNTALEAARRGATVTGIDLTPRQLELAADRAAVEGLSIELHEANAEDIPFPDGAFDAVVSVFAVIFAADHARSAAEMARVCAPGGTVAITTWDRSGGWQQSWRSRAEAITGPPPPGGPRPDEWGVPDEAVRRLEAAGLDDVTAEARELRWSFPGVDEAAAWFLSSAPPFILFQQAAAAAGRGDDVVPAVRDAVAGCNAATDGTVELPAPYFLVTGRTPEA